MSKEYKFKKLRNKDSYMNAFLERRKKAADFASTNKNKVYYKYEMPFYILKNEEEIMELKRRNKSQMNSVRNKSEFYKTYKTLKKTITNKRSHNTSTSNKVSIEKENNKYYLSQELPKEMRNKKYFDKNLDIIEKNNNNIDKNSKYNNIRNHTIDVNTKNKKLNNDNKIKRNNSWKDLQIQKTSSLNNYEINDNKNKTEIEINKKDRLSFVVRKEYEYEYYINNNKNKNFVNPNIRENDIKEIIEKYKNINIYNDGIIYKNYYESSPKLIELEQNYQYDMKRLKNFSESQNLFEKTKKIYSSKDTKSNSNYRKINNNLNYDYKSKTKEISPIKANYKYDIKEINENKKLEKKINNQTFNKNEKSRTDANIKLKNNLKSAKNNTKQNKNRDLNLGYKNGKSSNSYNKHKLKDVRLLYKNKKYYIENDINNLEIPAIVSDNPKEKEIKIIRNLEINNNKNKKSRKKKIYTKKKIIKKSILKTKIIL